MKLFKSCLIIAVVVAVVRVAAAPQEPTFNVVLVPTLVRDANGNVVYGLRAEDFVIEDDGIEQAPYLDEAAEAEPVSLIIVVQRGRRAWREFARMRGLPAMLEPVLSQRGHSRRRRILSEVAQPATGRTPAIAVAHQRKSRSWQPLCEA